MLTNIRIATLATLTFLGGTALRANNVTFFLDGSDAQDYTFTSSGKTYTEPVGPYSGYLIDNGVKTTGEFFCISFTKTASWNTQYTGRIVDPSTPQQVEAAYLDSQLVVYGGVNASLNQYKGPISMAIWQIMDPTVGDVPVDPAAQSWITDAQNKYAQGLITASMFSSTQIFIPDKCNIQSFMMMSKPDCPAPEPTPLVLMASGALLFGIARRKR